MKTKSIIATMSALALTFALVGCSNNQNEPKAEENSTPATSITVKAEGWNAETDTPALLQITSEAEEGAEPETTEFVVVEPNAEEATEIDLKEGNYDVAVAYPASTDGQAYARNADAGALTLTVEGDNPTLDVTLDQKRALTAEEIQAALDIVNASDIEQGTKDAILAAYTELQNTTTTEATPEAETADSGAAVATQSTPSSNSGSTGGSTPVASAPAPSAPAHQHNWVPVPGTGFIDVYTCCDGVSFSGDPNIARSQAAAHECALAESTGEPHGASHYTHGSKPDPSTTRYSCSCGATR